jgi:hypothetical protein
MSLERAIIRERINSGLNARAPKTRRYAAAHR